MRKRWKLEYAALALCILVCAAVWMTGVLDRETVWDLSLDYEGGDNSFALEDGDAYGVISGGTYCDLAPGKYRLRWEIESDADGRILLGDSVDVPIQPAEITFHSGMADEEAAFEIRDSIHSFNVGIEFSAGTRLKVKRVRLYSPVWRDNTYTFCAIAVLLAAMFFFDRRGKLLGERGRRTVILGFAMLIASAPVLRANSSVGYDMQFHAARIVNLADALRMGQFPARIGGFSYNGYGAATSVFYPDLLLYPWALALLDGVSVTWVIKSLVIATNLLTVCGMYLAVRRIFKDEEASVCAAVVYEYALYRLRDTYTVYMLGEMIAIGFFPLLIAGIWEILWGDERQWPLFAVSAALLWNSHVLTCLLATGLVLLCVLIRIPELIRNKGRISALVWAGIMTLALCLSRVTPLLDLWQSGVRTQPPHHSMEGSAIQVWSVFLPGGYFGLLPWLAAAAALVRRANEEKSDAGTLAGLMVAGGAAAMWLATNLFPWGYAAALTKGAVDVLQFPRRFCLFPMAFFAMAGGWGIAGFDRSRKGIVPCAVLAVAVLASASYLGDIGAGNYGYPLGGSSSRFIIRDGYGVNPYMVFKEYQLEGTDVNETRSRQPETGDGVTLADYEKNGTRIRGQVDAEAGGEITFPLFGFKGYEARLNGEKIAWRLGENNRLTVILPAGAKGQLTVDWKTPALWRVCDLISLTAALGLAAYWIKRRQAEAKRRIAP